MNRTPMTPEGHRALVAELKHLKEVLRPQIVRDIETARAHGDISENSEYEDAKERQSHCEGRIALVEGLVASAEIIDVSRLVASDKVVFGVRVRIAHVEHGEEREWRIVGEVEADVDRARISYKSPLGRAMIGRSVGEEVSVPAPGGAQLWEILEVTYG